MNKVAVITEALKGHSFQAINGSRQSLEGRVAGIRDFIERDSVKSLQIIKAIQDPELKAKMEQRYASISTKFQKLEDAASNGNKVKAERLTKDLVDAIYAVRSCQEIELG